MDEAIAQTARVSKADLKRAGWLLPIALFSLLWLELVNQLKAEWWLNPQYNYGLIVPLLAVYLFWKRWRVRPAPTPPAMTVLPIAFILFCTALFLPVRFLAEANPDWRLLSWMLSVIVFAVSLLFLFLTGGGGWLPPFCFPFLFFLVGVPLPVRIGPIFLLVLSSVCA